MKCRCFLFACGVSVWWVCLCLFVCGVCLFACVCVRVRVFVQIVYVCVGLGWVCLCLFVCGVSVCLCVWGEWVWGGYVCVCLRVG